MLRPIQQPPYQHQYLFKTVWNVRSAAPTISSPPRLRPRRQARKRRVWLCGVLRAELPSRKMCQLQRPRRTQTQPGKSVILEGLAGVVPNAYNSKLIFFFWYMTHDIKGKNGLCVLVSLHTTFDNSGLLFHALFRTASFRAEQIIDGM